jgi:hypothetical protein
MFERNISVTDVKNVLQKGTVIAEYLEDIPYPSKLILGFVNDKKPIHIVYAEDISSSTIFIITVYILDADRWDITFSHRRK